jgi:hypothetical protein
MVWRSQDLQSFYFDWLRRCLCLIQNGISGPTVRFILADEASKKGNHPVLALNPAK